jgi:hypothetical protein
LSDCDDAGEKEARAMTVLLVLVVVYFAVVSAPISIRSFGLVLARSRLRELPLPWRSTSVRLGGLKSGSVAAFQWFERDR